MCYFIRNFILDLTLHIPQSSIVCWQLPTTSKLTRPTRRLVGSATSLYSGCKFLAAWRLRCVEEWVMHFSQMDVKKLNEIRFACWSFSADFDAFKADR